MTVLDILVNSIILLAGFLGGSTICYKSKCLKLENILKNVCKFGGIGLRINKYGSEMWKENKGEE